MNTYNDRERLVLSEIGMMTIELISIGSRVDGYGIVDGLHVKVGGEMNPAKKAILNEAITMIKVNA
ncbi:hypothetical protein MMK73_002980 [Providencia rettgeri]|uniref:hypothetical protein n=1 Tax=Providencia sp. PROV148 TaxID=2949858 RepID=UPI00234A7163|nr:hypothetical protein [Providencia sp. PROV148]ELR5232165.1 hypothetical protein [Providencia rettgeri]